MCTLSRCSSLSLSFIQALSLLLLPGSTPLVARLFLLMQQIGGGSCRAVHVVDVTDEAGYDVSSDDWEYLR